MAPYCYRCPFKLEYPSCNLACVRNIENTIQGEGPETVAEVIVEPIMSGLGVVVLMMLVGFAVGWTVETGTGALLGALLLLLGFADDVVEDAGVVVDVAPSHLAVARHAAPSPDLPCHARRR